MATVPEIVEDQQNYASGWYDRANSFLKQLEDLARTNLFVPDPFTYSAFAGDRSRDTLAEIQGTKPTAPTRSDIGLASPDAPDIGDVPQADVPAIPTFEKTAPELVFPTRPSAALPGAPAQPEITDPSIPIEPDAIASELDRILAELSTLQVSVNIPDAPSSNIPLFTASAPAENLVTPSNTFAFYEQAYASANLDALEAKILNDLENGGYGIEPNDEQDLWDRQLDREAVASNNRIDEVQREFADRNFPVPPGAFYTALDAANQQGQGEVSDANRDIALRRSELYVQNRQFTIGQGTNLENILIGFHSSVMERTLNAERATLQASIDVFDASVRAYNARLQTYQTEAQVFESQLRAAATAVQLFRSQVEAAQLELENSEIAARIYQTSAGVVRQAVDLHTTRLQATRIETEIQSQRLDAFRAAVAGYEASVQAKVGEFRMYESGIRGESAKIGAYGEEVNAYRARVSAAESESNVKIANLRSNIERKRLDLQQFDAEIRKYTADLSAQVEQANNLIRWYQSDTSLWSAEANAITRSFDIALNTDNINVRNATQLNRTNLDNAQFQLNQLVETTNLRSVAAGGGLKVSGDIIQQSLGALGTLAAQIETQET